MTGTKKTDQLLQAGLVVYHIDDDANHNQEGHPGQQGWPENGKHYRVAVLQADGKYDLERGLGRGDAGDVFAPGSGKSLGPGPDVHPNTDAYANGDVFRTGTVIANVSAATGKNLKFDVFVDSGVPATVPPTSIPTNAPTSAPTGAPTSDPTSDPTSAPATSSSAPTKLPSLSQAPATQHKIKIVVVTDSYPEEVSVS